MTPEKTRGIFASLAIHGAIVLGLVLFSGISAPKPHDIADGTFMVELVGNDTGTPGIPDKKPGLAEGDLKGDTKKTGLVNIKPSDISKEIAAIEKQNEAEKKAAEDAKKTENVKKPETKPPTKEGKVAAVPDKKMSLEDFKKSQPNKNGTGSSRENDTSTKPNNLGGKPGPQIKGATVNTDGNGFGVAGGRGENGGGGGSASLNELYKNRIFQLLEANWQHLLKVEGGALETSTSGTFKLIISNNGNLSFGGWVDDPRNPLFEKLLRRAIEATGNCGARPAGVPGAMTVPVDAKNM